MNGSKGVLKRWLGIRFISMDSQIPAVYNHSLNYLLNGSISWTSMSHKTKLSFDNY